MDMDFKAVKNKNILFLGGFIYQKEQENSEKFAPLEDFPHGGPHPHDALFYYLNVVLNRYHL